MTMRTSGRLAACVGASEGDCSVTRIFMEMFLGPLQIAGDTQALERVLGFVIHGAPGALGDLGAVEFADDLVDGARLRLDREGNVGITERSVAAAVVGEVERNDRDSLAPRIGPDV